MPAMKTETVRDIAKAKERIECIRIAEMEIEAQQDKLLREAGWEKSCDFPGSFWMWVKQLKDGRTLAVSMDHAMSIQRSLDEAEGLYDDEESTEE